MLINSLLPQKTLTVLCQLNIKMLLMNPLLLPCSKWLKLMKVSTTHFHYDCSSGTGETNCNIFFSHGSGNHNITLLDPECMDGPSTGASLKMAEANEGT